VRERDSERDQRRGPTALYMGPTLCTRRPTDRRVIRPYITARQRSAPRHRVYSIPRHGCLPVHTPTLYTSRTRGTAARGARGRWQGGREGYTLGIPPRATSSERRARVCALAVDVKTYTRTRACEGYIDVSRYICTADIRASTYLHVSVYIYIYIYICMCVCVCMYMHIYMYMYTCMYTYIYIHIYIYIYYACT